MCSDSLSLHSLLSLSALCGKNLGKKALPALNGANTAAKALGPDGAAVVEAVRVASAAIIKLVSSAKAMSAGMTMDMNIELKTARKALATALDKVETELAAINDKLLQANR